MGVFKKDGVSYTQLSKPVSKKRDLDFMIKLLDRDNIKYEIRLEGFYFVLYRAVA